VSLSVIIQLTIVYWRNSMAFSKIKHVVLSNAFCSFLILTTIPSLFVCLKYHYCMGGHMMHPPYPAWHTYTDLHWILFFLLVAVADFISINRLRMINAVLLLYLCIKPFYEYPDNWFSYALLSVYAVAILRLLFSISVFIYKRLKSR